MNRFIEQFHNFLYACRIPLPVYEDTGDEISIDVPIIGKTISAPKAAPPDVEGDWHPKENLCERAIEMMKEIHIWELRGARLRVQLKDLGIETLTVDSSQKGDPVSGPADVLVMRLKESQFDEAKAEVAFLDEKLSTFSQDDLAKMITQIGLDVSHQLQEAPDDLAKASCSFILRLLASMDGKGNVREESSALGLIRVIENVLFFYIPFRQWGAPLIVVFCRVIRYLMEKRIAPFMARSRLESVEFFFNPKAHQLLPRLSDLPPDELKECSDQLCEYVDALGDLRRAQMMAAFEEDISAATRNAFDGTCRLFGSLVNGFATVDADMDVGVFIPPENWDRYIWKGHWEHWRRRSATTRRNVRQGRNEMVKEPTTGHLATVFALRDLALKVEEKGYYVERVESARVPILRCDKGSIHVDISLSLEVVFYNSRLLKCYSLLAPEIVSLSLLVKKWAKIRDVNDALNGTLSSYSYILLVIGFLQERKMVPNLQDAELLETVDYVEGEAFEEEGVVDLRFFDFEKEGLSIEEAQRKFHLQPLPSVLTLLADFFTYYAYSFNFYTQAISIKHGGLVAKPDLFPPEEDEQNIWRFRKRLWLALLDPFEPKRVLGCSARGQEKLSLELRRAVELITEGDVERLFQACDAKHKRDRDFTYSLARVIRLDAGYRSHSWLGPLTPLYMEEYELYEVGERRRSPQHTRDVTEGTIDEVLGKRQQMPLAEVEAKCGKIGIGRAKNLQQFKLFNENGVPVLRRKGSKPEKKPEASQPSSVRFKAPPHIPPQRKQELDTETPGNNRTGQEIRLMDRVWGDESRNFEGRADAIADRRYKRDDKDDKLFDSPSDKESHDSGINALRHERDMMLQHPLKRRVPFPNLPISNEQDRFSVRPSKRSSDVREYPSLERSAPTSQRSSEVSHPWEGNFPSLKAAAPPAHAVPRPSFLRPLTPNSEAAPLKWIDSMENRQQEGLRQATKRGKNKLLKSPDASQPEVVVERNSGEDASQPKAVFKAPPSSVVRNNSKNTPRMKAPKNDALPSALFQ